MDAALHQQVAASNHNDSCYKSTSHPTPTPRSPTPLHPPPSIRPSSHPSIRPHTGVSHRAQTRWSCVCVCVWVGGCVCVCVCRRTPYSGRVLGRRRNAIDQWSDGQMRGRRRGADVRRRRRPKENPKKNNKRRKRKKKKKRQRNERDQKEILRLTSC